MAKMMHDGLGRLQNQSHISASTWRQWCNLLKLDPQDAVDVWEEICHPILVATRKTPEVSLILQMRVARPELDIFDFKEEIPKVLHIITFLYALKDDRLTKGKIRSAIIKFYKVAAAQKAVEQHHTAFIQQLLVDLCEAILVAKLLPAQNISLSGVLKSVTEGRGTVNHVVQLGLKALGDKPYAEEVRECLEMSGQITTVTPSVKKDDDKYDDDDEEEEEEDEEEEDEEEEDEEEEEEEEEEEDEEEEEEKDDEEEEKDDEEDEDNDDDDDGDPVDIFLVKFKTALHAIYEAEAKIDTDDQALINKSESLLEDRLKMITLFKPFQATIPSIEEAQLIARRAEAAQNAGRIRKPTASAPSKSGGGSSASSSSSKPLSGAELQAMIVKGEGKANASSGAPTATGGRNISSLIETGDTEEGIEVAVADMVEPEEISQPELNEKVHQVGKLLSAIEPLDQLVWSLFLDPVSTISDCRALARTLSTPGTASQNAYQAIKQVARCIPLKNLLHLREQMVQKERNFILEVTGFINNVKNNRTFEANSRQLTPMKKILDHAVGGLVRLEALKTNSMFGQEYPDEYSREAVTVYYEEALRSITDLWDPSLRAQVRQRADTDTDAMLAFFEADKFVAAMLSTVRAYTIGLQDSGCTKSIEELKDAFAGNPLEFKDVEETNTSEVPPELLVSSGLGEICDEVSRYVTTQAWEVMQPIHQPKETVNRLQTGLREILISTFIFTPEMKRHQERGNIGIPVVSLDKVNGNLNLKDYYVRVRDDGQIAYLEDFEDGSFVDLFELREYKPSRVHAAAKKEAQEEQTEELQKGRKYLFTIGRTNRLFGDSPSDLINGCIRAEGGGPKIFPVF